MTRTYQPNLGITLEPTGPTWGSPWNPRAPAGARRSGKGPRRGGGSEGLESRGGLVAEALLHGGWRLKSLAYFNVPTRQNLAFLRQRETWICGGLTASPPQPVSIRCALSRRF